MFRMALNYPQAKSDQSPRRVDSLPWLLARKPPFGLTRHSCPEAEIEIGGTTWQTAAGLAGRSRVAEDFSHSLRVSPLEGVGEYAVGGLVSGGGRSAVYPPIARASCAKVHFLAD
jgi:hypothetical protein